MDSGLSPAVFFYRNFAIRYNSAMSTKTSEKSPDYLIIGHITRDILKNGSRLGGSAIYSSLVAKRMGLKVGLYTSCERDLALEPLAGIEVINQESASTTTVYNQDSESSRIQVLTERAPALDLDLMPEYWNACGAASPYRQGR